MQLLFTAKQIPNIPAIYKLTITGKNYVGSSLSLRKRLSSHIKELRRKKHHAKYLQNCFNKYGKENLYFEILYKWDSIPSTVELLTKEKEFIDLIKPEFNSKLDPVTQNNCITTSKTVYQYDLEGNFIKEWNSCSEVERQLKITGVATCARGTVKGCKSINGFLWKYSKDTVEKYVNNSSKAKIKSVTVYDLEGFKIKSYNSIADCSKDLFEDLKFDVHCAIISNVCNNKQFSYNGYRFSFEDTFKLENNTFKKGFAIRQLDKENNLIKIWPKWGDVKKHFNIHWSFNRQLKFQETNSVKFNQIHNFIWKKV